MITAITFGAYDLFHIGHLNLLRNAKAQCDWLVVGISTSERIFKYKNKRPVFSDHERLAIIRSCRFVDDAFLNAGHPGDPHSYTEWVTKMGASKWFVGSDWQGTDKFNTMGVLAKEFNCELIYLPHTGGISTTEIVQRILEMGKLPHPTDALPFFSSPPHGVPERHVA